MGQIDLFKNYSYSIWLCAKNFVTTQKMEIWTYNERDSLTFWHKISQDRLLCRSNQSIYELRLISAKSEIRDARKYEDVKKKPKSTFKLRRVVDKFVARKMSIYIYVYIYMRVCLCTCVWYLGSISSLKHTWLNNIDILCLHVFVFILSSRCIDFMVSGGDWFINFL